MNQNKLRNILKARINENALIYLTNNQGSKGKPFKYSDLQIAEYLSPLNIQLAVIQKQKMFAVRNCIYRKYENMEIFGIKLKNSKPVN